MPLRPSAANKLLRSIRLVVFDFDGVFTDNRVLVSQDGTEHVLCTRADGIGLDALRRANVPALVLSTETNPVVTERTTKLRLECIQGCDDKWPVLSSLLRERGIDPRDVVFVGNDVNDLECLRNVGVPVCVADAYPEVRRVAKLVASKKGGQGAVREICDLIVKARASRERSNLSAENNDNLPLHPVRR